MTKLAPILSHFLEQSVSLSDWSTHSCNTRLLAWQQCLDQSDKSCEEVLSKFKQYFQTKLMLHQMLPTFIATWGYTKPKKISVTAIGRGAKTITKFVYGP